MQKLPHVYFISAFNPVPECIGIVSSSGLYYGKFTIKHRLAFAITESDIRCCGEILLGLAKMQAITLTRIIMW